MLVSMLGERQHRPGLQDVRRRCPTRRCQCSSHGASWATSSYLDRAATSGKRPTSRHGKTASWRGEHLDKHHGIEQHILVWS